MSEAAPKTWQDVAGNYAALQVDCEEQAQIIENQKRQLEKFAVDLDEANRGLKAALSLVHDLEADKRALQARVDNLEEAIICNFLRRNGGCAYE